MTLRRLVLWRHGETDYNAEFRMQGQLDSRLTDRGVAQARAAAPVLADYAPTALISSDLGRAADTAKALVEVTGLALSTDVRLRETHLGDWQGLTHDDVQAGWPGMMDHWRRHPQWSPPGGETRVQVADRAAAVVAELDARTLDGREHETVVLCSHGGLISSLVPRMLGLPTHTWPAFSSIGNAARAVLTRYPGTWRLESYNAVGVG